MIIFRRKALICFVLTLTVMAGLFISSPCYAASCETIVNGLNNGLDPKVDITELIDILRTLNATKNRELPEKFITKKEASRAGWKPGKSLWSVNGLRVIKHHRDQEGG